MPPSYCVTWPSTDTQPANNQYNNPVNVRYCILRVFIWVRLFKFQNFVFAFGLRNVLNTPKGKFLYGYQTCFYMGADKSLALYAWKKKQFKVRHFSSDAEVIAAAETWLDGQTSEFFFSFWSGLQKSESGRCSLFSSCSG